MPLRLFDDRDEAIAFARGVLVGEVAFSNAGEGTDMMAVSVVDFVDGDPVKSADFFRESVR
jgi:hypothetical protein